MPCRRNNPTQTQGLRLLTPLMRRSPPRAEALDSHVNASLMTLNLAKATLQSTHAKGEPAEPLSFSIASFKRQALNAHLLDLFTATFALEPTLIKSHPNYQTLLNYGVIAA